MTLNEFFAYFFNEHTMSAATAAHYWWITALQVLIRVLIGVFAILLGF